MAKRKLRAISLYSGAGGLDYGFEAAGFDTSVALDFDKDSCETISASRDWPVIRADIHETSTSELLKTASLHEGDADILIGGPPCQPFSKSGYWSNGDSRRMDDPRAKTLDGYMRVVKDALPKAFLLENVRGIAYSGKEEGFKFLKRLTDEINKSRKVNYKLSWDVLNAVDYGVPQRRKRFFLVGHREGESFRFPTPMFGASDSIKNRSSVEPDEVLPYLTAWDAISDVDPGDEDLSVKGKWGALLPSIPEGENYLWHTNRKGGLPLFGWRTRYWSFMLKLAKSLPSWTIQAQPGPAIGPFHWESRRLSVREMARLQTFPDNVKFVGSRVSVQRQIGNAVPSLLAEVLAMELGSQFFKMRYESGPQLEIRAKRPIPPPERPTPVPDEFIHLVGDHPDHPGEGKGRYAVRTAAE